MDLSNKLKMLFLQFNFDMIYKIHKMLALLKNNLDSNNDSIFECLWTNEYGLDLVYT